VVQRKAPTDGVGRSGRVGTACAGLARDERGQALPLLLLIMVLFIAGGVLVYQLALSTNYATVAQTAADAAALAAENNVVKQMETPNIVGGVYQSQLINWRSVYNAAEAYATDNGGTVLTLTPDPEPWGYDVAVVVRTLTGLPAQSVDAGGKAYAEARASMDPLSSDSPTIPISNDASVANGPRYVPHTGKYGFFPVSYANYSTGDEVEIAGRLDSLGQKLQLHLVGVTGYSPATTATDSSLHTCGAVSTTKGLGNTTDAQLQNAGLKRMSPAGPNQPAEIALSGTTAGACAQGSTPIPGTPSIGNPNVHLVPWNGGPQDTLVDFPVAGLGGSGGPWVIPTPIVMCESGGRNLPPNSAGASGYYQIIPSTWAGFGGTQYTQQAYQAPKAIQDLIAAKIWNGGAGAANWDCAKELGYV
jgi:hypothetical protein